MALLVYALMAVMSALGPDLARYPLVEVAARAAAPIGACFTMIAPSPAPWASRCAATSGSGTRA